MNFDKQFDASGLACPLPILKTKNALTDMAPGQVLKLLATDAGSLRDMQAFADQTGHTLLTHSHMSGTYIFYVQKKPDASSPSNSGGTRQQR